MSIKQSLDKWIAEFESDGMCDISDQQVIALIRGYSALEARCAALAAENAKLVDCANFYRLKSKPIKVCVRNRIPANRATS